MSGIHPRLLSVHRGVLHCPSSYCLYRAQQIEAIRLPTSTVCLLQWLAYLLTYHNTITVPPTRYQYNIHRVQYCLLQKREEKRRNKNWKEKCGTSIYTAQQNLLLIEYSFTFFLPFPFFLPVTNKQQTGNPQISKQRIKLRR